MVVVSAWLARGLIALGITAPAAAATAADPSPPTVLIHADGSVVVSMATVTEAETERPAVLRQFSFGLPSTSPTRRGLEDEKLPIGRTQWEKDGIRYTQIVLLTRLGLGELMPGGKLADDSVLMVQVTGENAASEYSEATAEFSVRSGGRARELELREGRVYAVGAGETVAWAVVDVPATGIAGTKGSALRFRGVMPPGTSGAMTLKIPLAKALDEEAVKRLFDLEFDDEFRRVKRFWADRVKAGYSDRLPVAFAGPEPDRLGE